MAVIITEYTQFKDIALNNLDWDSTDLKLSLFTNSHTPNNADTTFASLANESSGTGYTAGGESLTSKAILSGVVTCDPVTWASLDILVRYAILYANGTIGGIASPVLLRYDLGSELTLSSVPWSFSWVNNEIYKLT